MSISAGLKTKLTTLVGEARHLFHLLPVVPGEELPRTIYVSAAVFGDVNSPWGNNEESLRLSQFRATLDMFSQGRKITVSENPFKKRGKTMLSRVDPVGNEVWDIRCIAPRPQIRCFGRFASKNTFVALSWTDRDILNWKEEVEHCVAEWNRFFAPYGPFIGRTLDDYLTNYRLT